MPQNEPTNEWLQNILKAIGPIPNDPGKDYVRAVCRALLAAREELAGYRIREADAAEQAQMARDMLAERDSQIAALEKRLKAAEEGAEKMGAVLMVTAKAEAALEQERESLRGELEAANKRADYAERRTSEWQEKAALVQQERDATRAGEARLREALEPFGACLKGNYSQQPDDLCISGGSNMYDRRFAWTLSQFRKAAEALSSSTDSAKWLEKRLADAEQRGYERGKVEGEIAGLRRAAEIVRFGAQIAVLREADSMERQLAARREREKASPGRSRYEP